MTEKEYSQEDINQNVRERIDLAIKLLRNHPNVVDTWHSKVGQELDASFTTTNPDTDEIQIMLGMERWNSGLKYEEEHGLVFWIGWDANPDYHCLERDGEEVPFSEWSDDFEWSLTEYETPIEEVVREAGYVKKNEQ